MLILITVIIHVIVYSDVPLYTISTIENKFTIILTIESFSLDRSIFIQTE